MGVEHCSDCGVCIADHDHHCPWTSKCIGAGNLKYFTAFVALTLIYIIAMVVVTALGASSKEVASVKQ